MDSRLHRIVAAQPYPLLFATIIIGHNIVLYLKPNASDQLQRRWCKWSIPIVGAVSLGIALYFKNIYTLCTQSWGILLVGVVAPMFAGVYWRKANTWGAMAGALAGTASWILCMLLLPENYPSNLFGLVVSCVALVAVSLLTQNAGKRPATVPQGQQRV